MIAGTKTIVELRKKYWSVPFSTEYNKIKQKKHPAVKKYSMPQTSNEGIGKDNQMLWYVCTYKDQNHARNGMPCDTLWKQNLDFEEAEYKEYIDALNFDVGED